MTKVRTYRINVDENARKGDAIVLGDNGCMTSQHLGTAASFDAGINPGNVPFINCDGQLSNNIMPSSVMKKCVYDKCCINDDAFDYNNFYNTPEIPVVNDPTVIFTQGGVTVGSISLNQSGPTTIGLMAGGVTAGSAIDINNNEVSVDYDNTSIGVNACDKLEVKDYSTIVSGAAAGATAVQADDLATVAMTGNYCDLINKPEIPSAQIQSDWEQTNTNLPDYIKNKPTIGNATITLQKNGANVDCFELNQIANKCINLTLSKGDVGLANVDNTADIDKPISTAAQTALNCKQDNITDLNTIRTNASCGKCAYDTIGNYGDIVSHNVCEFATATQGGKADTAIQPGDLATVATSGKYCDLSGTPVLCDVATSGKYCDLTGTPALCDVALSGSYNDLVNTPLLCAVATSAKYCDLTGTPVLCNVATTGCYSDLSGTPNLCTVATTGKYCDLTGKPTIPTDNCQLANSCGYTTCTGTLVASDLQPYAKTCELTSYAKCCDLKTVATSGKYCDLTGTPTIPTDNCQLANSCNYITNAVNDLQNYYLKCETYQKCEVDNLIANFGGFEVVSVLPTTNIKTNVIYLLGPIGTGADKYEEWIYYNNAWTKIGETTTDLSNYAKCCDIPTDNCQLGNSCGYTTCTGTLVASDLNPYAKTCTLCTVATSGKYCDLTGKPTIPTDNCQLANSCGYTTCTGTLVSSDLAPYAKSCDLKAVATSGKYCDLTGKPTIPTNNNQLTNGCGYTTCTGTLVASDLQPYTKTCDLKTVATSGKYCDLSGTPDLSVYSLACNMVCTLDGADNTHYPTTLAVANALGSAGYGDMLKATYDPCNCEADAFNYQNLYNKPSLCTVATSGKYCDLSGTPTLATVATSGCYNDLTGKPTIPTDNCQLGNGCNYITKSVNNLDNYTPTSSLATVATSGAYCDLTGKPTLSCVACTGCYDDLSGKPNLGVYQTTANMVCTLVDADNSHYPSAKTVADALSACGAGDMLKATYDPCNKNANAFDYNNFINKPNLCAVATSGKYCDLTGTPTIPPALSAGKGISIDSNKINAQNLFIINEDAYDVTYTGELGVAPYNTSYCYTNVCINPNCGIQWIEGAQYMFNINTKASNSACRNVRLKIGNGDYIPLMGTTSAASGNSYFTKGAIRSFQYTTKYESCGALHIFGDSNTTYSAMSCSEGTTGTCTCARTLTAACLKAITEKRISDNAILKTSAGNQTVCTTASGCTTPLSLKSNAAGSSYIAFNTKDCFVGSIGVDCSKHPVFYNGSSYTLAYTTDIPTDNCQLANGCGYLTSSSLCAVATSGKYCDLTGTPDLSCKQDTLVLGTNLHYDGDGKLQVGDANNDLQGMRYVCTSYLKTSSGALNATPTAVAVLDANGWICKQTPSCFINKMGFKTVATSGCYCDLTGKPTLCTVATSGKYCDLTGKPTIPTDNCQLANSCGYTTCTGTLTNSSLKTVNGCCLIGSGDICIQGGVTSVNTRTGAVCVCEVPSGGSTGQVLQKTSNGCGWATISLNAGDMCYSDFNWTSKSGATVTLDLSSTITPSANFTVNVPSTIKQGQTYVLRVTNGASPYTMTLGSCITNPFGADLSLTPNGTDQFVFFASSSTGLELQNNLDGLVYVTQEQYELLPSSKLTNGVSYFIYEEE